MSRPGATGHAWWQGMRWPLLGIAVLVCVNVAFDVWRVGFGGVLAPGSFLYISFAGGVPNGSLVDILHNGGKIMILAVGMTPVIATRGVDLSVGSAMAIAGALAAVVVSAGAPAWVAILAGLTAGATCGAWNAALVAGLRIQPFVGTLVLMVAGRGVAQMITRGESVPFDNAALAYLANGRPAWLPLPMSFLMALVLLAATVLALRRTAGGLLLEAAGANPEAARLSGVRSRLIIGASYVFSGACAGLAGLVVASSIKAADPTSAGVGAELGAIFAVVVGGTALTGGRFTLVGAAAGALLLQTLTTTMLARDVSADVAPLGSALLILGVCLASSPALRRGVMRRRAA